MPVFLNVPGEVESSQWVDEFCEQKVGILETMGEDGWEGEGRTAPGARVGHAPALVVMNLGSELRYLRLKTATKIGNSFLTYTTKTYQKSERMESRLH